MGHSKKILQGAEELFFKYGIKAITMDDIAKHLAISKKTIYQYYKEKEEIINTLMNEKIKEDEKKFSKIHSDSTNVIQEVFAIMRCLSEDVGKINPVIFYELQKFYPEAWKKFTHFKENFIRKQVEESLKRGQEQGYVRKDVNTGILSRMRMEQIQLGFNTQVFPQDKFTVVEVQLAMTEHFLYGICTLKGHKLINKYKELTEDE
jgi:TetR/AcrR family transcriptional regulator, cholesterol catabolism regulator